MPSPRLPGARRLLPLCLEAEEWKLLPLALQQLEEAADGPVLLRLYVAGETQPLNAASGLGAFQVESRRLEKRDGLSLLPAAPRTPHPAPRTPPPGAASHALLFWFASEQVTRGAPESPGFAAVFFFSFFKECVVRLKKLVPHGDFRGAGDGEAVGSEPRRAQG